MNRLPLHGTETGRSVPPSSPAAQPGGRLGGLAELMARVPACVLACLVACLGGPSAAAAATKVNAEPVPGEYRVEGGRVDSGTLSGWRIFHTSCHGCHGIGGQGTDIAPNLLARIKNLTPRGFATKVLTSYRIVEGGLDEDTQAREALLEQILRRERSKRGQVVMPAWESDQHVPPHVLDLYAYLNARADGVLGPGRPRGPLAPARK